jgi:hypothetical protein
MFTHLCHLECLAAMSPIHEYEECDHVRSEKQLNSVYNVEIVCTK